MMFEVRKYTPEHQVLWDSFVRNSRSPLFMFERGYMDYHSDRFEDESLMFYRDNELLAVMPASRHDNQLRSHGGLTYGGMIYGEKMKQHTMLDCFSALREFCDRNEIATVLYKKIPHIFYLQPAEEDQYALFVNNAQIVSVGSSTVVNVKCPYKMLKGRKAQITRAKREGVVISETKNFDAFFELENNVLLNRHGVVAVHTAKEMELLQQKFPKNISCVVAFYDGAMIAGAILFVYDSVVHTQYLAADDKAREIGALDLVVSECLNKYSSMQFSYFDFGTSQDPHGGGGVNEGLKSQKEGFGGRTIVQTTWELSWERL